MIKYYILAEYRHINIYILYVYQNIIIIDHISVFYHTRIKLAKSSSIKCDETEIQNLIASSSDLSLCKVRDDKKLYHYVRIIRKPSDCRSCTHSYMCVLECAYVVVCGALDKSCEMLLQRKINHVFLSRS